MTSIVTDHPTDEAEPGGPIGRQVWEEQFTLERGPMGKKLLPDFCAALVIALLICGASLWNRVVGLPYHYRISAGHLEKDDPNNGKMWQLRSDGWHNRDK